MKSNSVYRIKICEFPGCGKQFVPYRKARGKYCGSHTEYQIRKMRKAKLIKKLKKFKKPTKLSMAQSAFIRREIAYENVRLKAIASSPDISKLLWFTPDNGKTLIYCKNELQLNKAKELFKHLHPRQYTLAKE